MYNYKYPHPAITSDCVIFTFIDKELQILLIQRKSEPYKGFWALPGGFMEIDETIESCASRELKEETGLENVGLEQFHIFSEINRDPRERILSVAFMAFVHQSNCKPHPGDDAASTQWFNIKELPKLAFDHKQIINLAKKQLPEKLKSTPLATELLNDQFQMGELQMLYEIINETI